MTLVTNIIFCGAGFATQANEEDLSSRRSYSSQALKITGKAQTVLSITLIPVRLFGSQPLVDMLSLTWNGVTALHGILNVKEGMKSGNKTQMLIGAGEVLVGGYALKNSPILGSSENNADISNLDSQLDGSDKYKIADKNFPLACDNILGKRRATGKFFASLQNPNPKKFKALK